MTDSDSPSRTVTFVTRAAWGAWIAQVPPGERETGVKRRDLRRAIAAGPIQVRYAAEGRACRQACWVLEVSAHGLTLRAPRSVPEGAFVDVWWPDEAQMLRLRGDVAHCTETVGGYKLGVKLDLPETAP